MTSEGRIYIWVELPAVAGAQWLGSSLGDFFALPIKNQKKLVFQGGTVYWRVSGRSGFFSFSNGLVKIWSIY